MTKAIALAVIAILAAALTWSALYFRARVPPNCTDPRTLALVRQILSDRYHLPIAIRLENIRTTAGGFLALRFVCEADLAGIDPHDLPAGMPIPGQAHFISRLTSGHSRHEVFVTIEPLLLWEKAQ